MAENEPIASRSRVGATPGLPRPGYAVRPYRGRFGRWGVFARSNSAQRRLSMRGGQQAARSTPDFGEPPSLFSRVVSALRSKFGTARPVRDPGTGSPATSARHQEGARAAGPQAAETGASQTASAARTGAPVRKSDEQALAEGHVGLMSNYLANQANAGHISPAERRDLQPVVDVVARIDADIVLAAGLLDKSDNQTLTESEQRELSSLVRSQRHNLVEAQRWLGARLAEPEYRERLSPAATTLLQGIQGGFANRLMDLADLICLYEFEGDPNEPVSRADTAHAHVLYADAALKVARDLDVPGLSDGKKRRLIRELQAHRDSLAEVRDAADRKIRTGPDGIEMPDRKLRSKPMPLIPFDQGGSRDIRNLRAQWARQGPGSAADPLLPLTHPSIGQARMLREFIEFRLAGAGVAQRDMPDLAGAQQDAYGKAVNEQPWEPIAKKLVTRLPGSDGKRTLVNSRIEPGKAMAAHFAEDYPANGINSGDRTQYRHVPNLARTSLTNRDGSTLFDGLRHGVIDAYDITPKLLARLPDQALRTMIADLLVRDDSPAPGGRSLQDRRIDRFARIRTFPQEAATAAREMREQASKDMAREVAAAALIADPEKFQRALDGETVDLDLSSVSMLTPDTIRYRLKGSDEDEKTMLRNQRTAFADLAGTGPATLTVRDETGEQRTVTANVKVRQFNFGVNAGAVHGKGKGNLAVRSHWPGVRNLMGWGFAMAENDPELVRLLGRPDDEGLGGDTQAALQRMRRRGAQLAERSLNLNGMLEADPQLPEAPQIRERIASTQNEIDQLARSEKALREAGAQLKTIWAGGDYMRGDGDPYKMVSRLALVSQLMGETPLFNCKSGKDRTGQLDAEVKFLATVADEQQGQLPPADQDMERWRSARSDFTLNTGNLEIQQMNTGLPGYKLKGVPGLENMISEGMKPVYRGGSDYTSM